MLKLYCPSTQIWNHQNVMRFFIANCVGEMKYIDMVEKIKTYKEVVTLVYGRQTVVLPATKFILSTVMALICCDLIKLDINFD